VASRSTMMRPHQPRPTTATFSMGRRGRSRP
jgi:hypothetical protein